MKEKDFGSIDCGISKTTKCRYTLLRVFTITFVLFLIIGKSNRVYAQVEQTPTTQKADLNKNEPENNDNEEIISVVVDNPPMFNGKVVWRDGGGEEEFKKYIVSNLTYPEEAFRKRISGRVVVEFTIDEGGSLIDAKVIRKAHRLLNSEALRIINSSPQWSPGIQKGKPVKVRYVFPVNFNLPR